MSFDDLLDAWQANDAVNRRLLALCPDASFELKPGKGKTIRSNWVHLVGLRRAYVEERARMRAEAEAIPKLDWKTATREEIVAGLEASREPMARAFERLDAKPSRWTAARFFAYVVAHEAHHRSQIEIALRLGGMEPSDAELYALWDWPKL